MICNICNKEIDGIKSGAHKRWCGHVSKKSVIVENKCKCGKVFETKEYRPRRHCSASCASKFSMTQEVRQKISKSRSKYLKDNPDAHPWKNKSKHNSEPCERFKQFLRKNDVSFMSEVSPVDGRYFSIDIAFPEEKVGIEINGNQHYNSDKSLKKYYKERHELIESAGWRLFEIHYSQCFSEDRMSKILQHIKASAHIEYIYDFEIIKKQDNRKHGTWKDAGVARKLLWDKEQEQHISAVQNSGIDFSKFGWVGKVALIINQKPQKVKNWMIRIMPEFYNKECFKRRVPNRANIE
jgi:very-short-patch-repair endonuclease